MEETKGKNRFIVLELLKKLKDAMKSLVGNESDKDEKRFEEALQYVTTQESNEQVENEIENGIQKINLAELAQEKGEVITSRDKQRKDPANQDLGRGE